MTPRRITGRTLVGARKAHPAVQGPVPRALDRRLRRAHAAAAGRGQRQVLEWVTLAPSVVSRFAHASRPQPPSSRSAKTFIPSATRRDKSSRRFRRIASRTSRAMSILSSSGGSPRTRRWRSRRRWRPRCEGRRCARMGPSELIRARSAGPLTRFRELLPIPGTGGGTIPHPPALRRPVLPARLAVPRAAQSRARAAPLADQPHHALDLAAGQPRHLGERQQLDQRRRRPQ